MATIQVTFVVEDDSGNVDRTHETGLTEGGFDGLMHALQGIDGFGGIVDGPTLVEGD